MCIYIYIYIYIYIIQKLYERQGIFEKLSYQEKDRENWNKVLICDMMSSEESDEEGPAGSSIVVKSLPWRSTRVNNFMKSLGDKGESLKSHQSLRQKKRRVIAATSSSHPRPGENLHIPAWAFSDNECDLTPKDQD